MAKTWMNDLVVLLPGITGSVLEHEGRDVWALSGGALWEAFRSLGGSVKSLALPPHTPGTIPPDDGVRATRLMPDFHGMFGLWKIDGYGEIARAIREGFGNIKEGSHLDTTAANFIQFPYDWRRSNRESAAHLKVFVDRQLYEWRQFSGRPDARVILIGHSMGGLVSRYYLEVLEGWRTCRALVTFGTPYWGSVDAIRFVTSGFKKAFVDLTGVLRSLPSVYELMASYRVVLTDTGYQRVADVPLLPNVDPERAADAARFHAEIDEAVARNRNNAGSEHRYRTFPMVGVHQPTLQSVELRGADVLAHEILPPHIDANLAGGDGTVPRVSASPNELFEEHPETFLVEKHGSLQNRAEALDDVVERLRQLQTGKPVRGPADRRVGAAPLGLRVDDLYFADEPIDIQVSLDTDSPNHTVRVEVEPVVHGKKPEPAVIKMKEPRAALTFGELPPGRYRLTAFARSSGPGTTTRVSDVFEVAEAGG